MVNNLIIENENNCFKYREELLIKRYNPISGEPFQKMVLQ